MEIEKKTLYWLAGLLEGEGSFRAPSPSSPNQVVISVQMTDEDIIAKVAACFGTKYQFYRAKKEYHKNSYIATLKGSRAIEMMKLLYPLMGKRRQAQIDRAINAMVKVPSNRGVHNPSSKLNDDKVREIRQRLLNGERPRHICQDYGVSEYAIRDIEHGRKWKHVQD
jgi:hypothetical protein